MSDLAGILAYRNVYVLTIIGEGGKLKGTHYACCLSFGPEPLWGVWTVAGKFLRFFGRKSEIKEAYPQHVWRTKAASWNLRTITDEDKSEARKTLMANYA